jgi:hypothetical protein
MSENGIPGDRQQIPSGYRGAIVTAITVMLGFSFLFLRSWAFELPGDWTVSGAVAAILLLVSILLQLTALWRSLQLKDEVVTEYAVTLRWFLGAILMLLISLVTAALSYSNVLK